MFGWLKRLFGIAEAETNAALSKLENPIKMTEQGIRDLKTDLNKSLQSLAEVKAMHIRAKKELEMAVKLERDYEAKAILLLQKAERGEIAQQDADRLATQALAKKEQLEQRVMSTKKNVDHYEPLVRKMETNVNKLKDQIGSWEGELKTLKARSKVSEATAKLNKQMARIDSSDTLSRLERMKEKVAEQEALAESYADIADTTNTSIDDEIDKVLGPSEGSGSEALTRLKAKLENQKLTQKEEPSQPEEGTGSQSSGTAAPTGGLSDLEKLKQKLKDSQ
ncbi:PspA/IM30 family protein [Flammeovirgaceae bacterium SG7u.111]|nr:PspA/IM30 family protein [Flammeovirgaceae bacterium SG7u.132]WPO36655.1 PspA/IM30 family protein [Flammeovirgaceae bacterium SG7u.111]